MDINIESLEALRDRASRVLSWVNQSFDDGEAVKRQLTPEDRHLANSWYYCIALFASELNHAGYQENPEQHTQAVKTMVAFKLERLATFESLERQYLEWKDRTATAVNKSLNLASGGVGDDE